MKKIYTLIAIAVTATTMRAQLTMTQSAYDNVPGDVEVTQQYDSVNVLPRNTGQNQLWDFSAIVTSTNTTDTNYYVSPSAVPASSMFPGTTVVKISGTEYDFFKSSSGLTEELGYDDANAFATYSNTMVQNTWPISYGYSNTDTYSGNLSGQASGTRQGTTTVNAVGTGTVKLPGGVQYTNVLQLKLTLRDIQLSAAGNLTIVSTGYSFFRAGEKSAFITVADINLSIESGTYTSSGSLSGVIMAHTTNTTTTGIAEHTKDFEFSVFPNPANANMNVTLSNPSNETCVIEIYDALGSHVKQVNAGANSTVQAHINTSDLKSGIYFVRTTLGKTTSVKKVVIE